MSALPRDARPSGAAGEDGGEAQVQLLPAETLARVVAIVRPARLDAVIEALLPLELRDVLVEPVRGYGRQKEHLDLYGEGPGEGGFLPKVRLQFVVAAGQLQAAVDAVRAAARTGRIGDGKIFVHAVGLR
jgi:nitrogen regulatory protein PII